MGEKITVLTGLIEKGWIGLEISWESIFMTKMIKRQENENLDHKICAGERDY